MRTTAKAAATAALSLLVSVAPAAPPLAVADDSRPGYCSAGVTLRADELPSTLRPLADCVLVGRRVYFGYTSVVVPPPGFTTKVRAYGVQARSLGLDVETLKDLTVRIHFSAPGTTGEDLGARPPDPTKPDPCATDRWVRMGHKAYSPVRWYYNSDFAQPSVAATAVTAIELGANHVTTGYNDCGITSIPRADEVAGGATTRSTNVLPSAGCAEWFDNVNVVGWGELPNGVLATTCVTSQNSFHPDKLVDADVKITTAYDWMTARGELCLDSYDLESVMTHEWGHIFGLDHVAEDAITSTQTMSFEIDEPCDSSARTLGRGDLAGLAAIYGTS